jgi:hypothetical protein
MWDRRGQRIGSSYEPIHEQKLPRCRGPSGAYSKKGASNERRASSQPTVELINRLLLRIGVVIFIVVLVGIFALGRIAAAVTGGAATPRSRATRRAGAAQSAVRVGIHTIVLHLGSRVAGVLTRINGRVRRGRV